MTASQIHAFFKSYADAFSRSAIDEICGKWAYPAYMVARGKRASLNEVEFRKNTEALCKFYRAQRVSRADKEVLELTRLTPTIASVRTADTVFDEGGEIITSWEHVYLLSQTDDGLRAVAAMPDAELEAWQARGTPLGPW